MSKENVNLSPCIFHGIKPPESTSLIGTQSLSGLTNQKSTMLSAEQVLL